MRLQGGVVANNSDVRERPTQLASRSLPGEACSGYLTCWTAQAQAWLIPEPDAGLVQVQSQDRAARWYLAQQEMEPLPHSCCLGEQKMNKNRLRFCSPIANQKQSHGPQTGAALRPPKCNERRATDATIWHSQHGPWPASSPLADFVQSGHLTISMNFSQSCASLKHLPPSATTQGSRGISTYDWWISPPPPLQVNPHRSKTQHPNPPPYGAPLH